MKKSLRFFLICTISIAVVFSIFSISNAQTSTELNMDDLLTADDDSSQTTQTDSNNEINNQTQNSTDDVPEIPEIPAETETVEEKQTETKQAEEKTTETKSEEKTEEVQETKLPQTGETENYLLIVASIIFAFIAVYAYRKNKKYNV